MGRPGLPIWSRLGRLLSTEALTSAAAVVAMILGWEIASQFAPSYAVPSWGRILTAMAGLPPRDIAITLGRVIVSIVAAFAIGLGASLLLFERRLAEAFVMPFVRLLMAVPAVCWVVFAILWFRNTEFRIFFVMVVVCAPVFLIDSTDAMKSVPADLRQMVNSYWPTRIQFFTKLILPAIRPSLLTSWKINMTNAIRIVTIAELVGALTGIGRGLVIAQEMFSVAQVFAWTFVLVIILFIFQLLFGILERSALRWRA